MSIKSMKCDCCGSKNVNFSIDLGSGCIHFDKNGYVTFYYATGVRQYENEDGEICIIDVIKNTKLSKEDWDYFGIKGTIHEDPNYKASWTYITGECLDCKDESYFTATFSDGEKLSYEKAFVKLYNELTKQNTKFKISTNYLKTLIPQYIDEQINKFKSLDINDLKNIKNWKRASRRKDENKNIIREFKYFQNNINLSIHTNKEDTKVVKYEIDTTD